MKLCYECNRELVTDNPKQNLHEECKADREAQYARVREVTAKDTPSDSINLNNLNPVFRDIFNKHFKG